MRFGLRNQPLKLKNDRRFVGELLLYGYLGKSWSRATHFRRQSKAIQPVMLDLHHFFRLHHVLPYVPACGRPSKLGNFLPECLICRYSELY